jgi:hypothetical protein
MNFLDKVLKINGTFYKWNDTMKELSRKSGYEYGLIAQEVQKEFPEMVIKEDDGYLSIDYIQMIPVLVECIKELKIEIDSLKFNK